MYRSQARGHMLNPFQEKQLVRNQKYTAETSLQRCHRARFIRKDSRLHCVMFVDYKGSEPR